MSAITSVTTNFLADLPEEVSHNILLNLNVQQLGGFCLVSHQANRIASDDKLWERLVSGPATGIKAYVNSRSVRSLEEIREYLRVFMKNIQLNKKGVFICEFPFKPEFHITIGYKSGTISPNIVANSIEIATDPDFQLVCYFMAREHGEPEFGIDVQGGPSESFFVTTKVRLPKDGTHKMELARQLGQNVRARLEYLQNRSMFNRVIDAIDTLEDDPRFQRFSNAYTVACIAFSVIVLGLHFMRRR